MIEDKVLSVAQASRAFQWVDVQAPTNEDLSALAAKYRLPFHAVRDCLEPEHFPKFESFGALNFLIVRSYDANATIDSDTVQELTRKIAIFESDDFVLTIHRSDIPSFHELKDEWRHRAKDVQACLPSQILLGILNYAVQSYQKPAEINRDLLEGFERKIFRHDGDTFEEGYFLKRRASAIKRMLRMTVDMLPRLSSQYPEDASLIQDVKENSDRLYAHVEEFYDNVTSLVGLQLALSNHRLTVASFKTNEVMRILTIFSVFFMPLNLITGIYGMNFENMPELKWAYGYYVAVAVMIVMTLTIMIYFKRKGVLDPSREANAENF
jgi:magnesium transporter